MASVGKYKNVIEDRGFEYEDTGDRYKFASVINNILSVEEEDKCHYISFNYLKESLTELANMLRRGEISQGEFDNDIDALTDAVLKGEGTPGLSRDQSRAIQDIYTNVSFYRNSVTRGIASKGFLRDINLLLYYLNSVDRNLRVGNANWNHSIGKYYDPDRWLFAGADGKLQCSNQSYNIKNDSDYGNDGNTYDANTFYLVSQVDIDKLDAAYRVQKVKPIEMFTAEYRRIPMIYSSNNCFAFQEISEYQTCEYPITRI